MSTRYTKFQPLTPQDNSSVCLLGRIVLRSNSMHVTFIKLVPHGNIVGIVNHEL